MKKYDTQPFDLLQYIYSKYHDPFIHELLEFEDRLDTEKLIKALDKLVYVFPLLKCCYDNTSNTFIENENYSGRDLLRIDDAADRNMLLTEALDTDKKLIQFTISKNILVITISHLICDGSSFKQLIYLLCDIYNGNSEENFDYLMHREFSMITKELTGKGAIVFKMLFSMIGNYKNSQVYNKSDNENAYITQTSHTKNQRKAHKLGQKQQPNIMRLGRYAKNRANRQANEIKSQ